MNLTKELVARVLSKRGLSKGGLARAWGARASAVSDYLTGKRLMKAEEIAPTITYLGLDHVPIVGRVSAGAKMIFFPDHTGDWERVPAPLDATEKTVAVEVEGTSLGPLFDRWLVFYDRVERPISRRLIGKLCVVGLPDGEVLVKQVKASRTKGLFHLYSNTAIDEPILDQEVDWAARVKSISPK